MLLFLPCFSYSLIEVLINKNIHVTGGNLREIYYNALDIDNSTDFSQFEILSGEITYDFNVYDMLHQIRSFSVYDNVSVESNVLKMIFVSLLNVINISIETKIEIDDDPSFLMGFEYCTQLKYIYFANISRFEENLFKNCYKLISVEAPALNYIGKHAFQMCIDLETIIAPNVINISDYAFYHCTMLKNVDFPNLINCGDSVFEYCSIISINFPFLENVSSRMFLSCEDMTIANLSSAVYIGAYAFFQCFFLREVNIPKVERISEGAFNNNYRIEKLNLPSLVSADGNFIVECYQLKTISMPKLERIPDNMFANLTFLPELYMPNVTSIGKHAFENVDFGNNSNVFTNLKITEIDDYAFCNLKLLGILLFNYCEYVGNYAFYALDSSDLRLPNVKSCGHYAFGETYVSNFYFPLLETCGDYAFSNNIYLENITFPQLKNIGNNPFEGCKCLTVINLPSLTNASDYFISQVDMNTFEFLNLKYIGSNAFTNACDIVEVINLPNALIIGDYFLNNCYKVTNISLPKLERIGSYAFYNCSNLINVSLPKLKSFTTELFCCCNLIRILYLPELNLIGNHFLCDCYNITNVSIPNVETINNTAFVNCSSLTELSLNSVTKVIYGPIAIQCQSLKIIQMNSLTHSPSSLFYNIESLENVSLKEINEIKNYTFYNCRNLRELYIPKVTVIGSTVSGYEFSNCSSLETLNLPTLTNIFGTNTFQYCTSLKSVNFSKLKEISEYSFLGCKNLISVSILNVQTLPSYCFKDCVSLETLLLNGVTEFKGDGHFSGCINLKELNISKLDKVNKSSTKIFENCGKLDIIALPDRQPETFNDDVFDTAPKESISICLPKEDSYDNYKDEDCSGSNCDMWKGVNIETDDQLEDKCKKYSKFVNSGMPTSVIIALSCFGGVILISGFVLLFYLYRKNKAERETLENMPHLSISIVDTVI